MGILGRLLEKRDNSITHTIDRPLTIAIPEPRAAKPDQVLVRHLTPHGQRLQVVEAWDCCKCCTAYSPQPCPVIHPGACDKPECQPEDVA